MSPGQQLKIIQNEKHDLRSLTWYCLCHNFQAMKFNKVTTKSKHLEIQLYNKKTDLRIEYHLKQFASMI